MQTTQIGALTVGVLAPRLSHRATLIWTHGLGDSAAGFAPLFSESSLFPSSSLTDHTRIVLPNAPHIPVTLNMGMVMPAWYDILSLDRTGPLDTAGIARSSADLGAVIAAEGELLASQSLDPSDALFVGGFSQGGAISTQTLIDPEIETPTPAALIAWSAYVLDGSLPGVDGVDVLVNHGTADEMVTPEWAMPGWEALKDKWDPESDFQIVEYPGMGHEVSMPQIAAFDSWISPRLSPL